jgi:hypothetical protein
LEIAGVDLVPAAAVAAHGHSLLPFTATTSAAAPPPWLADAAAKTIAGMRAVADFPLTPNNLTGQSKKDGAMVAKFSADGNLVWSRHCGSDKEYFYSVKVHRAGACRRRGRIR